MRSSAAELAAGNLCFCFPETCSLFSREKLLQCIKGPAPAKPIYCPVVLHIVIRLKQLSCLVVISSLRLFCWILRPEIRSDASASNALKLECIEAEFALEDGALNHKRPENIETSRVYM